MILYDIMLVLVVMCLYIVLPGLPLSYMLLKDSSWSNRFCVSSIFGTIQFYFIYFALKHGLAELYVGTIFFVMGLFIISSYAVVNDVRGRIQIRLK